MASSGEPANHKGEQSLVPFSINCDDQHEMFGPKLPPGLEKRAIDVSIGPALPPEWQRREDDSIEEGIHIYSISRMKEGRYLLSV